MKIGINISNLDSRNQRRGIGFYTENLYRSLKALSLHEVILIQDKNSKEQFDVIHYPFFDFFKPTLPFKRSAPTVVTIHDVTPLLFPKVYPPGIKGRINLTRQKLALKNIRGVITDSISSKNDIEGVLKISSEKIFPIHLAPRPIFKIINDKKRHEEIRKKYNLTKKFCLFMGDVNWNKNLNNMTQAVVESGVDFYLVGGGFDQTNIDHPELKTYMQFISNYSKNPKVHILGFVSDKDLVRILNLASILLLPSYYEGFGLPILEAQVCSVPVITSNISSMPEVAGEGAILINPKSINEIKNAIIDIMKDEKIKIDLLAKGFENVKRFSWEKTALETLKVYEMVVR